jgi:MoaA/NifB/PqqE/SkfB family radical SAM enzyme
MADNGNQLPQKLFNKALAIIEEKIKPILEDKEIGVKVGYPLERILDLNSGYQSKKCLAKRLVSFISNEKKVYPCVEKAFIEEELGTFKRDSTFSELFEKSNLSMTTDCPPICLLHELNKSFENIQKDGFPGGLKILSEPASEIDDDFYFL